MYPLIPGSAEKGHDNGYDDKISRIVPDENSKMVVGLRQEFIDERQSATHYLQKKSEEKKIIKLISKKNLKHLRGKLVMEMNCNVPRHKQFYFKQFAFFRHSVS